MQARAKEDTEFKLKEESEFKCHASSNQQAHISENCAVIELIIQSFVIVVTEQEPNRV